MTRIRILGLVAIILFSVHAGAQPPRDRQWAQSFVEECEGKNLDEKKWTAQNDTWEKIASRRLAKNIVLLGDGVCRLAVHKEPDTDKPWSTAGFQSDGFAQLYGYFEVRMKYAQAQGLDQAFWLTSQKTDPKIGQFEIDINEGDFPDSMTGNLHTIGADKVARAFPITKVKVDGRDFHTYGLSWVPGKTGGADLAWYVDDKRIAESHCETCTHPAIIRLTNAVAPWRKPTDALDGKQTQIMHIRAWKLTN